MNETMKGKTAIITGGASGIGLSISRLMLRRGANVVVADINCDPEQQDSVDLHEHSHASVINIDFDKQSDIEKLIAFTVHEFGTIDIIVNNAKPPLQRGGVEVF
ncbi:MAG: SDR family NAD(P)-dependent oxidoreductase, partial [Pseudomonadales bacterium]